MTATTTETDNIGKAIEVLAGADQVNVTEVLASIAGDKLTAGSPEGATTTPPEPTAITEAQRDALARLPELFGRVSPTTPAPLSLVEADALLAERTLLVAIEKLVKTRKEDIRAIVSNALDAALVESGAANSDTPRDAHGWCLIPGEVAGAEHGRFARSVRRGSVSVDLAKLEALADDPECDLLDHSDWLALTRQTRVFDEGKAAIALRANPALLRALSEATVTTGATTVITQKQK